MEEIHNTTSKSKSKLFLKGQTFMLLLIIVGLSIVIGSINPNFATTSNLFTVFQQISVLGIATMSMTLLLISGLIDLSIGGMISLTCVAVTKMSVSGVPMATAVFIGVVMCIAMGFCNGIIVSKSKCPPLIITLGMSYLYSGLSLVITAGVFIPLGGEFSFLGRGVVLGIPFPMILVVLISIFTFILLKYTRYGRRITAIGGNSDVSFLAGISVEKYQVMNYTISGAIIALASLVLLSRLGSVLADMGGGYELRALAAAIIGGVSLYGGKGSVLGAFLGVVLMGILSNGMNLLAVNSYYQTAVLGAVIVIAVVLSNIGKIRKA